MYQGRGCFGVLNLNELENEPLLLLEGGVECRHHEPYDFYNDRRPDYPGYLFQYTLEGCGYYERDGKERLLPAEHGFLVHFPEKSRYFLPVDAEDHWHFIYLRFDGDAAAPFAKRMEALCQSVFYLSKDSLPIQMALEMHQKMMEGRQLRKYEGGEFLYRFLCSLTREIEYPSQEEKNDPVAASLRIMEEEYASLEGIEALAQRLGLSKEHFSRSFTKRMKLTPVHYLTNIRLQAAMKDLLNTDASLDTIACKNGFSGSNYFCKVFRKYVHETPTEYRQKSR